MPRQIESGVAESAKSSPAEASRRGQARCAGQIARRSARGMDSGRASQLIAAAQLYHALYAERRFDFASMSNLPARAPGRGWRNVSASGCRKFRGASIRRDGSVRYLLALDARGEEVPRRTAAGPSGSRLHALGRPANDLYFDASGMRGGLPFLPDRATGADSQSHRGRNRRAGAARARGESRTRSRRARTSC